MRIIGHVCRDRSFSCKLGAAVRSCPPSCKSITVFGGTLRYCSNCTVRGYIYILQTFVTSVGVERDATLVFSNCLKLCSICCISCCCNNCRRPTGEMLILFGRFIFGINRCLTRLQMQRLEGSCSIREGNCPSVRYLILIFRIVGFKRILIGYCIGS